MPCPGQNTHCHAGHRSLEALMLGMSDENVFGEGWTRSISPPIFDYSATTSRCSILLAAMLLECHTTQQCGVVPALFERVDEAHLTVAARFCSG